MQIKAGYLMWPDGSAEVLPPTSCGWRDSFAGVLICPRTGEWLCKWGWGEAHFECFSFHPTDKYMPLFENYDYLPTIRNLFPEQVMRRLFLYLCEEAEMEGKL